MPAILAIPFRLIFHKNFYQEYLAQLLGAAMTALTMLISWKIKEDKKQLVWVGLLTAFGNIVWYMSSTGSSWYLGQITSAFFLTAAIQESLNKKRPISVGVFLGASFLARLQVVLSLPFFLYLLFDKKEWFRKYLLLAVGMFPFVIFNFYYNFIRFGTIFDKGYSLIPGVLDEPWFKKGLFNISYIPNGLKTMFLSLPKFNNKYPYITPSWAGLSILITTPAFVYSLFARIKEKAVQFSWLSIIFISVVVLGHGSTGFAQFGYRFAVDFYPLLIFLTIKGISKTGIRWHHWLLLIFSILVNLWGVIWINKLGWVSF